MFISRLDFNLTRFEFWGGEDMKAQQVILGIAAGVMGGGALYVLGAVGAAVVPGIDAPVLAAVGFASGFVGALALKE